MNVLIVKLSSIGDIVHTLPTLALIRREIPDAGIGWAVDSRYAEILRGNTLIDHLIEIDIKSLRGGKVIEEMLLDAGRQFKPLRQHKFDVALDVQGLLKSATLARWSGAKKRWGFARKDLREPASRVFYTDTVAIEPQTHVIRKNIALASKALGLVGRDSDFEFPIFTNDEHRREAEAIGEKAGGEFVILNPAGGWITKLWHPEKYGELADMIWEKLGLASVIAIGPNDDELAAAVLANGKSGKAFVAKPSLKGLYELGKLSRLYVGGDTGPTHIAVAAGTPVVGIFGPTEWWRNGSVHPDDICVERDDIGCRVDCHRRTCSNWICMDIAPETVFEAVERRLKLK
ncbi:MAG: lipopolysaccharide heptosyltransferase I [Pyrinomonadaceae bacterium]